MRHFVVGKSSGIRAAAQPTCKVTVTQQNTLERQGKDSVQTQLRQHNLYKMRIKRLEDDKSAWHDEGSTAQANIIHSAAAHMSQGPGSFTKDFMVPPSRFLNSASQLGSLTPPEATSAHTYVALNVEVEGKVWGGPGEKQEKEAEEEDQREEEGEEAEEDSVGVQGILFENVTGMDTHTPGACRCIQVATRSGSGATCRDEVMSHR